MEWALIDRVHYDDDTTSGDASQAAQSVLARLPADCHEEFLSMLREACSESARRRLCITQSDQPMLMVDILPLRPGGEGEWPALVVLHDSGQLDSSYERFKRLARRNEAILLSAMDGFFVVDDDCRFLEVNEAFSRMLGYNSSELLNMRITDVEVNSHDNGGVPSHTRTGLHHFPTAHRHKDGRLVHLEISINVLHDGGRKILVGFARDVTERKRAEEEYARLTRQQKLILDSAAEGIVGLNDQGRITFVNPATEQLLGRGAVELIGRAAHDALLGSTGETGLCTKPDCPVCTVLRQDCRSERGESEFRSIDGVRFPVEYSVTAMCDGTSTIGAVLVFKDVTERHRAAEQRRMLEAQIQQAQKLESLGLLAGGIAHDLNNMLAGIQGNASLALSEVPDQSRVGERLRRIIGGCDRAGKVIQQILAYSGQVTCDPIRLDLNEQIEEMTEFMRAAVPRNIALDMRLAPETPATESDSGQLQQVITNLLVNAAEAIGDESGRITISTECITLSEDDVHQYYSGQNLSPGDYVALRVADTGCGMSPETVRRAFEPFFSEKGAGRGLGLSAMLGVVRAQGGGVRVESTLGEGSSFTVVLPACESLSDEEVVVKPRQQAPNDATVLVIDDEDDVRDVIRDMLTYRGMRVLTAENGERGIETFKQYAKEIDVVLLDMTMPGKSGGEVFREILGIDPEAQVIIASGYSRERVTSRFDDKHPAAFVHKPFTADTLLESIASVLKVRKDAREVTN